MNMSQFTVIGLTGGSGSGKGEAARVLAAHGIPSLNTDEVSRLVCQKGWSCLEELTDAFGDGILLPDGTLNRQKLAGIVFGEPDPDLRVQKLNTLNSITHRYILDYCRHWLGERREAGCRAACIDAPQLFESGFDRECDLIIGICADKDIRIRRICQRDGITYEKACQRIDAQYDDRFFAEHCDVMIENNGSTDALAAALTDVLLRYSLCS
ncbi:MAG: dephospho-CoA kinase [Clostridia bacterium]|nr:dephospho-CoA kinase [Clostridia bacterium]